MNKTTAYDKQIRSLMDECRQLSATRDSRALPALSRLGKIAEGMGDPGLQGFVYFHTANYHYVNAEYNAFHNSLGLAIRSLLRSSDFELLARTLNFFAIEAYGKGALDVAYNYYMIALQFVENNDDSAIRGFLLINLAGLFSRLEYYREARRYFKKGLSMLKKNRKDLFFERNMIAAYIIDGLNSIAMGDIRAAEKTYRAVKRIVDTTNEKRILETRLAYAVFETRLALAMHETKKVRAYAGAFAASLAEDEVLYEAMDDIRDFGRTLIEAGFLAETGQIIDAVNARVMASGVTHAMLQLTEMKVDFYEAAGDEKNLMKCLTEQNRLFLLNRKEQEEIYRFSIENVRLVGELREEEARIRRENEVLQDLADRDALCGIPNRYAMDRELERAFEHAYTAHETLGIGIADVDGFKELNDTFGHQTGDRYLAMLGKELSKLAKDARIFCARYGGDEFLIIYEGMREAEVFERARAFHRTVAKRRVTLQGEPAGNGISISQGICCGIPRQRTRLWDFLSEADTALYEAKRTGSLHDGVMLRGLTGRSR